MTEHLQSLTVAIPYYKNRYFEAALESLARQTDQKFDVFVGDDASPEDPSEVIQKFQGRLKIRCRRFPDNMGRHSLVAHWNRCVRESSSEWVWLFSDDDVASPNCIAEFYKVLAGTGGVFDLYRFNTKTINASGKIIHDAPRHPVVEQAGDFLFAKFAGGRTSFAVEYIFRREAFETAGGFIDFPLAWFSDDASWIAFSRRTGIRTMPDANVFWRLSDLNISAVNSKLASIKLNAFRKYLLWLRQEFPDRVIQKKLRNEVGRWFPDALHQWGGRPDLVAGLKFWFFFTWFTHKGDFKLLRRFVNITRVRGLGMLKKLFR